MKISRRQFVKAMAAMSAASVLAACVGNSLENGVNIFYMTLVGNQHFYVFHFISFFFFLNDYLL